MTQLILNDGFMLCVVAFACGYVFGCMCVGNP